MSASVVRANTVVVQTATVTCAVAGTCAAPFPLPNAAGDLIAVFCMSTGLTPAGDNLPTDTRGNTYNAVSQVSSVPNAIQGEWFYAMNVAAGANTVTCNYTRADNQPLIAVYEISGAAKTAALDNSQSQIAASATDYLTTPALTTSIAGDMLLAAWADTAGVGSILPGAGWTVRNTDVNLWYGDESQAAGPAGSYIVTATAPANNSAWIGASIAIKAAAPAATGCGVVKTVRASGGNFTSIQAAVNNAKTSSPLSTDWCINVDSTTYGEQVSVSGIAFTYSSNTLTIQSDPGLALSTSATVSPPAASTAAFLIANSSVNLRGVKIVPANAVTYGIYASSAYVAVSSVTVLDNARNISAAGIYFDSQASWSSTSYSSVTMNNSAAGLKVNSASNVSAVGLVVVNSSGGAAVALTNSAFDSISWSTMTSQTGIFSVGALTMTGSSSNTVSNCFISAANAGDSGPGAYLDNSSYNTISFSTLSSRSTQLDSGGVDFDNASADSTHNLVSNSYLSNPLGAAVVFGIGNAVSLDTIALSTVVGGSSGVYVPMAASFSIRSSYVQGSTAVYVAASSGTFVGGSVLAATGAGGAGLAVIGGGANVTLTSSTILGGGATAGSAGVYVGPGAGGLIVLSTNAVSAGFQYGVFIASPLASAQIYLTSNTVVPAVTSANDTYGLYLNGLTGGATIQNNTVSYRAPGSMGAFTSCALYARSASGLVIDHNRFDEPGMITAGSYIAVDSLGVKNTAFKFNDVYSSGTNFTNAFLLNVVNASSNLILADNIFVSSFGVTVTGSSATLAGDGSVTGFTADYNDYSSSNSAIAFQSALGDQHSLAAWAALSGQDAHSISADPLWSNVAGGVEDFHPKSTSGRYNPATQSFVADGAKSPTIDAGDPAEAYASEPAPNGARVNQGSYGGTAQASMSPAILGCVVTAKVGGGQPYATISLGLASLPTTLTGPACVLIEDGATYPEQVTVRNIANNGFAIDILPDPVTGLTPTVSPPAGSTAAFVIAQASVNVSGFNIVPTNAMTYGVYVSSAFVTVSSVSVQDAAGRISAAGIRLDPTASWATVSYASVTAGGAGAAAFYLNGSSGAAVSYSSAQANGANAYGLYLNTASSNTFTVFLASNPAGYGAYLNWFANYNLIQLSTMTGGPGAYGLDLNVVNFNTVDRSYMAGPGGAVFVNASSNTLARSTFSTTGLNASAVYVTASSNSITQSWAFASSGTAVFLNASSNTVSFSTMVAAFSASNALYVNTAAGGSLVSHSYAANAAGEAAYLGSSYNTLSASAFVSNSTASAVYVNATSNTITGSVISNPAGTGLYVNWGYDLISLSTVTTGASGYSAVYLFDPGSLITRSYVSNSAGDAVFVNKPYNTMTLSTFTSAAVGGRGLFLNDSYAVVSQCLITNPVGDAVYVNFPFDTIVGSTITSGGAAYEAVNIHAATTTIMNSYLQGPLHAVNVWASTGTRIGGSVLAATGTGNSALYVGGGSVGLNLSSSTLLAPSQGTGAFLDTFVSGVISLSTNVFSGAQFGVFVTTMSPGTKVFITSNTFLLAASPAYYTWGLMLNGLTTGATVQNNAFVYRTPASGGATWATPLQATTASGLSIDHNRFANPGMITGGSYSPVYLVNATNVSFRFNDLFSTGTALVNHDMFHASAGSTGLVLRDNVFFSSVSVTGSSATVIVDAASQAGFSADYNDYFSSNAALGFQWGSAGAQGLAAWKAATAQETNSLSAHPLWAAPAVEDFHPLSTGGRWDPAAQGFVTTDGATSPTVDAGDPAEPYAAEPGPNGLRANQGSYGGTAEASKTLTTYPGCAVAKMVKASGGYDAATISGAVALLPTSLTGRACVVIKDAATYAEQVTVQGFTNNGSSITIFTDPSVGAHAVVAPPAGSTAAFAIANASVSVSGVDIRPGAAVAYGVAASSAQVRISSVNVDSGGTIWAAGVMFSAPGSLCYSSITVQGAHGVMLSGSSMTAVSRSTVSVNGTGFYALYLTGASSNTVSDAFLLSAAGGGLRLASGSDRNSVVRSTIVSNGTYPDVPVIIVDSSSNTLSQSYVLSPFSDGLDFAGTAHDNRVDLSAIKTLTSPYSAVAFQGGGYNTVDRCFIDSPLQTVYLAAAHDTVSASTITANAAADGAVVIVSGSQYNTLTGCYAYNPSGMAVYLRSGANGNTISQSTMTSAGAGDYALWVNGASYNTVVASLVTNSVGDAVGLDAGASFDTISLSTVAGGGVGLKLISASTVSVSGSYIQGSTAVVVSGSTGTAIGGTVLVATNTAGDALYLGGGSVNLSVSSTTLASPTGGRGLAVGDSESGSIVLSTLTVTGARFGVSIGTPAAAGNASLVVTSVTFANLASGATAFQFAGGVWVSTLTTASFDASVSANVNGSLLAGGARLTMRGAAGSRYGPAYEDDPSSLVDWPDLLPPTAPTLWSVGASSIAVQFGAVGADGYALTASTASDFSGTLVSSTVFGTQLQLAVPGLLANTTYYLRTGALWNQATVYAQTAVSTATLAKLVAGTTIYQVGVTSIVVNWLPLSLSPPDASSNSASGYLLQASTAADFSGAILSSQTAGASLSTLTVSGLAGGTTYFLRVGSLNWDGVPDFAAAVSTLMPIQLGVVMTTHTIALGAAPMATTVAVSTSIVLTNVGNVTETYQLRVTTTGAPSPWSVGAAPGLDRYSAWTVVNSTPASSADYLAGDLLGDAWSSCAASAYTMGNQTCVRVPAGQTRTIWVQVATPLATSTTAPQSISVTAQAVKDP